MPTVIAGLRRPNRTAWRGSVPAAAAPVQGSAIVLVLAAVLGGIGAALAVMVLQGSVLLALLAYAGGSFVTGFLALLLVMSRAMAVPDLPANCTKLHKTSKSGTQPVFRYTQPAQPDCAPFDGSTVLTRYDTHIMPDRDFGPQPMPGAGVTNLRVILADDHLMVLEILSDALSTHAAMKIMSASTLDGALALADATEQVDLIVLDWDMPGMHGCSGLAQMVDLGKAPVAVLTAAAKPDLAAAVRTAGAVGLMCKSQGLSELVRTMVDLCNGGRFYFAPQGQGAAGAPVMLSEMHSRVIGLIEAGYSNKTISAELDMPLSSVKMHVRNIFKQLGARNRTDAVRIWHNSGAAPVPYVAPIRQS